MNNTATPTDTPSETSYFVVAPVRGTMLHGGYRMPFTYSDGTSTILDGTFCAVNVKYRPSTSKVLPLDEVAARLTCPTCRKAATRIAARKAAES